MYGLLSWTTEEMQTTCCNKLLLITLVAKIPIHIFYNYSTTILLTGVYNRLYTAGYVQPSLRNKCWEKTFVATNALHRTKLTYMVRKNKMSFEENLSIYTCYHIWPTLLHSGTRTQGDSKPQTLFLNKKIKEKISTIFVTISHT